LDNAEVVAASPFWVRLYIASRYSSVLLLIVSPLI
jgi:hypothetical protein